MNNMSKIISKIQTKINNPTRGNVISGYVVPTRRQDVGPLSPIDVHKSHKWKDSKTCFKCHPELRK